MKEKRETKDMKDEAEKYQKTLQELADHEIQEKLFKLFHAEQDIQLAEGELKEKQQELSDLVRGGEGERVGEGKGRGIGEGEGRGGGGTPHSNTVHLAVYYGTVHTLYKYT